MLEILRAKLHLQYRYTSDDHNKQNKKWKNSFQKKIVINCYSVSPTWHGIMKLKILPKIDGF